MPTRLHGFRQLALANWRELVRDPKTFLFSALPFIMLGSRVFFPLYQYPGPWGYIPYFSPASYMVDALQHTLGYPGELMAPLWVDFLAMLAAGAGFTAWAIRRFRWDQGEERMKTRGHEV